MNRIRLVAAVLMCSLTAFTLLSGCTHSIDISYQADAARLANASALEQVTVGVAKFEDKRAWVEADDPKTESFVSQAGPHKFGLTYLEKDFFPVKDLIQDVLIKELTMAGLKAKPLDFVLSKSSAKGSADLGKDAGDYQLGGQILAFDYNNQAGMWTVTSRRTVIINMNLYRRDSTQPFFEQPISEMDTKEYAMGVVHSVNVENLVREVFRKVAHKIVQLTAEKITP
jgi:hypothetical protein